MNEGLKVDIERALNSREYDSALLILADRKNGLMANAWSFQGHPHEWKQPELAQVAQQMAALTIEQLKADANNRGAREVLIKNPLVSKVILKPNSRWWNLGGIAFRLPKNRLLVVYSWISKTEVLFGWYFDSKNTLNICIGPLLVSFAIDK